MKQQKAPCNAPKRLVRESVMLTNLRNSGEARDRNFLFVRSASCSSAAGSGLLSGGLVPQSVMPTASRGLCKGRYGK